MKISAVDDKKKSHLWGQKGFSFNKGGVPPAIFILVKEFVDLHCNQVNTIKGIGFACFNIAKGEE